MWPTSLSKRPASRPLSVTADQDGPWHRVGAPPADNLLRHLRRNHRGHDRWVGERTISGVLAPQRSGFRYDRTEGTLLSVVLAAVALINLRRCRQATEFPGQV